MGESSRNSTTPGTSHWNEDASAAKDRGVFFFFLHCISASPFAFTPLLPLLRSPQGCCFSRFLVPAAPLHQFFLALFRVISLMLLLVRYSLQLHYPILFFGLRNRRVRSRTPAASRTSGIEKPGPFRSKLGRCERHREVWEGLRLNPSQAHQTPVPSLCSNSQFHRTTLREGRQMLTNKPRPTAPLCGG